MMSRPISDRNVRFIVLALMLIGFWLRFRCLGCLGFRWDEDLTALAVKALLENGVPELPSGMIYLRFFPYQWLLAGSALVLDVSEFSLRIPGVILSTAMIPLGYWIAAQMFDRRIGIIVAAALALSFEQVEMARTARMYAPFFVVYLVAAFAIYKAYFADRDRLFSVWPLLFSLVALSLHQLAYSLALIFVVAILLNPSGKRAFSLILQAGFVGAGFLAIKSIIEFYFYRGQRLLQESGPQLSTDQQGGGLLEAILDQITLPQFELLSQVTQAAPVYIVAIALLAASLSVWIWRNSAAPNTSQKLLGLTVIVLCTIHQFNLAIIVLAAMLVTSGNGLRQLTSPDLYRPIVGLGVLFAAWIAVIFLIAGYDSATLPIVETGLRKMVRALIDYPNFRLFWSFALERPLLAIPLGLGTLWAIDQIAGKNKDARALFLVGTFWGALFLNGILRTKYEFFRYNLHLDVFFLMLVAIGIVEAPRLLRRIAPKLTASSISDRADMQLTAFALAFIVISVNPVAAALTSSRDYYEDGFLFRTFGLSRYQDFATPGEYVRSRLEPADRVFVLEPREYWNYIGRVDYWIASDLYQSQTFESGGTAYDLYLGIPVLDDRDKVSSAIRATDGGNVWILYPKAGLDEMDWISDSLKGLLTGLTDHTVYTGRDRQTVVIRIPPDDPLRETNH